MDQKKKKKNDYNQDIIWFSCYTLKKKLFRFEGQKPKREKKFILDISIASLNTKRQWSHIHKL